MRTENSPAMAPGCFVLRHPQIPICRVMPPELILGPRYCAHPGGSWMSETTSNLPIEKCLAAVLAIRTKAYDQARTYTDKKEFSSISKSEAFAFMFDELMPES